MSRTTGAKGQTLRPDCDGKPPLAAWQARCGACARRGGRACVRCEERVGTLTKLRTTLVSTGWRPFCGSVPSLISVQRARRARHPSPGAGSVPAPSSAICTDGRRAPRGRPSGGAPAPASRPRCVLPALRVAAASGGSHGALSSGGGDCRACAPSGDCSGCPAPPPPAAPGCTMPPRSDVLPRRARGEPNWSKWRAHAASRRA